MFSSKAVTSHFVQLTPDCFVDIYSIEFVASHNFTLYGKPVKGARINLKSSAVVNVETVTAVDILNLIKEAVGK